MILPLLSPQESSSSSISVVCLLHILHVKFYLVLLIPSLGLSITEYFSSFLTVGNSIACSSTQYNTLRAKKGVFVFKRYGISIVPQKVYFQKRLSDFTDRRNYNHVDHSIFLSLTPPLKASRFCLV